MVENGWNEYQKLVLDKIEASHKDIRTMRTDITELKIGFAVEKSKLRWITGGIAAFVSTVITSIIVFIRYIVGG